MLSADFFNRDSQVVAKALLGKVLHVKYKKQWLMARIIETEAYYKREKGSHASLGFTEKRKALFMPPGTIYMYYARGGDSLNFSCRGEGNAVLIKSGTPFLDHPSADSMLKTMQKLNPPASGTTPRPKERLCNGQTLLCKALGLKVPTWDAQSFDPQRFFVADHGVTPSQIIQCRRLGIPQGRDEDLPYRFVDFDFAKACTQNPLRKRKNDHQEAFKILKLPLRKKATI